MTKHQRYNMVASMDDGLPDMLAHIADTDAKSCLGLVLLVGFGAF